jgi:hypothetical protein
MKHTQAHIAHLILTYHEGTLNPTEKIELEALLLENPSLALDLEEQPSLIAPPIQINSTSFLHPLLEDLEIYKDEEGHPLEKLAIGNFEGELNEQEQKIVHSYTQDTLYQKIEQELAHTKLVADQTIQYPQLNKLLKTAPVRQLNWRPYVMVGSSAAAVLLAVFMIGQANTNDNSIQTKPRQQARLVPNKKTNQSQTTPTKNTSTAPIQLDQVSIHPQLVDLPTRDCIVQEIIPSTQENSEILVAQNINQAALSTHHNQTTLGLPYSSQNTESNLPEQGNRQVVKSALAKEPVTVKTFLLQKTNERLFGTTTPTADLRYETMARYASETIGIPVRYRVEEAPNQDKLVFQLGPITIEKTRTRK